MFLETILLGGLFLVVTYWNEIVNWLKELVIEVRAALKELAHAIDVFVQRVKKAAIKFITKVYYKAQGKWIEEKTTREIPEAEVPEHIRKKVQSRETNINKEIEQELQLTL
jgi:hypothetical protein